jgi:hypothetical protein
MDNFLLNLFEVDRTGFQVIAVLCSAGVFLMAQTTDKTAASLIFYPVLLLCALAVRSAAIPLGIYLGMEEGEFIVFTTTVGMCIGLGLFALYSRFTSTAT